MAIYLYPLIMTLNDTEWGFLCQVNPYYCAMKAVKKRAIYDGTRKSPFFTQLPVV